MGWHELKRSPEPPGVFFAWVVGMLLVAVFGGVPRPTPVLIAVGLLLIVIGMELHRRAWNLFRRRSTTLATLDRPSQLVTDGVYLRTRNPMYLGGVLILAGWAFLLHVPALIVAALVFGLVAQRWWIRPEEALLRAEYTSDWDTYCSRTRRWL